MLINIYILEQSFWTPARYGIHITQTYRRIQQVGARTENGYKTQYMI